MTSHTLGNWVIYERDHFSVYAEQDRGEVLVAHCNSTADADLIAAAPDLLATLKAILALPPKERSSIDVELEVETAIAKAEKGPQ